MQEIDYSDPSSDDFEALSRDRAEVRSLQADDAAALIRIYTKTTGHDSAAYISQKVDEALTQSGVRVSLVAEVEGLVVGFVMARVDRGAFGALEPAAVMDTIGVHPAYADHGIGRALMSQLVANLNALQISTLHTEIQWGAFGLEHFLDMCGFKPAQRLALRRPL